MTPTPTGDAGVTRTEAIRLLEPINASEMFARRAHAGQTDKGGAPYTGHLGRVAARARAHAERLGLSAEIAARCAQVGWLHDTIEDTRTYAVDLMGAGFERHVVDAVIRLTRISREPYLEWVQAIADSGDLVAIIVKLADNEDNLDPSRMLSGGDSRRQRYEASAAILRAALIARSEEADHAE